MGVFCYFKHKWKLSNSRSRRCQQCAGGGKSWWRWGVVGANECFWIGIDSISSLISLSVSSLGSNLLLFLFYSTGSLFIFTFVSLYYTCGNHRIHWIILHASHPIVSTATNLHKYCRDSLSGWYSNIAHHTPHCSPYTGNTQNRPNLNGRTRGAFRM